MIIDAHAHYTSAPPQLQAFRGTQITNYARPAKGRLNVSDEQIVDSVKGQVGRMDEWGIDRLMFSPQATAMGHQFGTPLISRHWTEHCNELIGRIAQLLPDRFSAVCQLPQSPGIPPSEWVDELDRCVNDLGFNHKGGSLFMAYLQNKEQLANKNQSGSLSTFGIEGIS